MSTLDLWRRIRALTRGGQVVWSKDPTDGDIYLARCDGAELSLQFLRFERSDGTGGDRDAVEMTAFLVGQRYFAGTPGFELAISILEIADSELRTWNRGVAGRVAAAMKRLPSNRKAPAPSRTRRSPASRRK